MAGLFHRLIQKCAATGETGAQFNGSTEGRRALRQALARAFPNSAGLADLNQRPNIPGWHVSISHTADLGAWVATAEPRRVGLDIERRDRLRLDVIRRVCVPGELERAPQPLYLWSAKEACFKGTLPQPQTISEIEVQTWSRVEDDAGLWLFHARGGHGWIGEEDGRIFALYTELSQPKNT